MSEPLLNVMKIMLLAGLYLFFVRVLWSVFSELRDPRTVARKRRAKAGPAVGQAASAQPMSPHPMPAHAAVAETVRSTRPASAQAAATAMPVHAPPASVLGQLIVVEPPALAGTSYPLGAEITIGRAPTNGIILDDTYVSTVHARIFSTNGSYFIEDLSSRNGSTLNGAALIATTALMPRDRVQVGATTLEFL